MKRMTLAVSLILVAMIAAIPFAMKPRGAWLERRIKKGMHESEVVSIIGRKPDEKKPPYEPASFAWSVDWEFRDGTFGASLDRHGRVMHTYFIPDTEWSISRYFW